MRFEERARYEPLSEPIQSRRLCDFIRLLDSTPKAAFERVMDEYAVIQE